MTNKDKLIINGKEITDFMPEINLINEIGEGEYKLLLIDLDVHRFIIFKDNNVYITGELEENSEMYKCFVKDKLISIDKIDLKIGCRPQLQFQNKKDN